MQTATTTSTVSESHTSSSATAYDNETLSQQLLSQTQSTVVVTKRRVVEVSGEGASDITIEDIPWPSDADTHQSEGGVVTSFSETKVEASGDPALLARLKGIEDKPEPETLEAGAAGFKLQAKPVEIPEVGVAVKAQDSPAKKRSHNRSSSSSSNSSSSSSSSDGSSKEKKIKVDAGAASADIGVPTITVEGSPGDKTGTGQSLSSRRSPKRRQDELVVGDVSYVEERTASLSRSLDRRKKVKSIGSDPEQPEGHYDYTLDVSGASSNLLETSFDSRDREIAVEEEPISRTYRKVLRVETEQTPEGEQIIRYEKVIITRPRSRVEPFDTSFELEAPSADADIKFATPSPKPGRFSGLFAKRDKTPDKEKDKKRKDKVSLEGEVKVDLPEPPGVAEEVIVPTAAKRRKQGELVLGSVEVVEDSQKRISLPRFKGKFPGGEGSLEVDSPKTPVLDAEAGIDGRIEEPEIDISIPEVSEPNVDVTSPLVSTPAVGGDISISGPKVPRHKQGEVHLGDVEIVEEQTGFLSRTLDKIKKKKGGTLKGPEVNVSVNGPDVEVEEPDLRVEEPDIKLKGEVSGPDVDIESPKVDVSGGGKINLKGPKVKQGEVYLGDSEIVEEKTGSLSRGLGRLKKKGGKFEVGVPGVKVKGPEVEVEEPKLDVSVERPDIDVDVRGPKVDLDIDEPEADIKFKKPDIDVDVEGPDADIDLKGPKFDVSGGGDIDLKTPKVKQGEVYLGDLEIVEERTGGFSPSFGWLKKKGKFEVNAPDVNVRGPDVQVTEPLIDVSVDRPDLDVDVKGPKVDVDVDKPDIDIKGPEFDVSGGGDIDLKTPKVKQGEVYLGDLEIVEERTGGFSPSFGWLKSKGKVDIDAPDVDIKGPEVKVEAPEVDVSIDKPDLDVDVKGPKVDVDVDKPDIDIKGPEFDVSGGGDIDLKTPKVKQGEVYLGDREIVEEKTGFFSRSLGRLKKKGGKVDITVPGVDVKAPEVEIEEPKVDVSVERPDVDVDVRVPKGELDIEGPEGGIDIKAPDVDVDVEGPKVDVDVEKPDIDIKGPKLDVSGGGKFNLKKPKIKQGEVYLGDSEIVEEKTGSLSRGLGRLKKKGGKFEVSVPGVKVKGPEVEVEEPKLDVSVERPDIDVDVRGPKVDLDIDEPEADIKFKKPDIDVDVEGPDADIDLKGPKFDVSGGGDIDLKTPKVKQGEVYLGDLEIVEERTGGFSPSFGWFKGKGKVDVDAPDVDIKGPEFEVEAPEVDVSIDKPDLDVDVKGPKVDVDVDKPDIDINGPEFDVSGGGDIDLKTPKVKQGELYLGDLEVVEERTGGFSPSFGWLKKKGKVDIDAPDVDIKGPEVEVEAPEVDVSIDKPDLDVDVKGPKVDVDVEKPDIDIKGPKLDVSGGGKFNLKKPKVKQGEVYLGDSEIVEEKTGSLSRGLGRLKKKGGKFEVSVPGGKVKGPKVAVEEPKVDVSVERPDIDVDVRGPKVDLDIDEPEADIKFKKPDIDVDLEGPDADIDLKGPKFDVSGGGDIDLKTPKVKQGEVYLGDLEIVEERTGGFSPSFGWFKGKGKVDVDAPDVDIKGPEFEVEAPEVDVSIDKPDLDVDVKGPKVDVDVDKPDFDIKGPEFDVSGGGDIDLKTPKVKQGELYLGDLEVVEERTGGFSPSFGWLKKKGKVDIDAPDVDIKGPEVEVEAPEVDVSIDKPDFDVDVKGPKVDVDVEKPDIDIKGPKLDVSGGGKFNLKKPKIKQGEVYLGDSEIVEEKTGSLSRGLGRLKKKGGKFEVSVPGVKVKGPKVEVEEPKVDVSVERPDIDVDVRGPKVDLDIDEPKADIKFKKPDIDVDLEGPDADIDLKGPKFDVSGGGDIDLKTPKVKQGEVYLGDLEIVEERTGGFSPSFGWFKGKGKVDVDAPDVDIKGPEFEVEAPEVDVSIDKPDLDVDLKGPKVDVDVDKPDIDINGPEFDVSGGGDIDLKTPKVKQGELYLGDLEVVEERTGGFSPSFGWLKKKGKVDIDAPDVDIKGPEVEVEAPEVDVSIDKPDVDVDVKGPKVDVDVEKPDIDIKGPKLDVSGGGKFNLKKPKVKQGEVYLGDSEIVEEKTGSLSRGLGRLKKKGGKFEVSVPGGKVKGPKVEVEEPKVDVSVERPDIDVDVRGPKVDLDIDEPEADIKFKKPDIDVDLEGPDADIDLKGPKFDVSGGGDIDLKTPKVKQGEVYLGDLEIVEERTGGFSPSFGWFKGKGKVDVDAPDVDIKGPEFEVEAPEVDVSIDKPDLDVDVKGPNVDVDVDKPDFDIKGPEFDVSGGGDIDLKTPKVKQGELYLGDLEVVEERTGGFSPSFGWLKKKGKVDIDAPDVDIKGPEVEVEAPEVDVSIDKPDLDVDVKGPKVDVDVEKPDIDIKGPKLDVSGGGKFNLKKPKIKQGEVYLGDSEIVEEKTGSLSRGLGRLKKKGGKFEVGVPGVKVKGPKVEVEEPKLDVSVERPDIDVDVRGPKVDLDIDEPKADIKFKKPDIDVDLEGPDADIDLKGPKFDVSGGGDIDLKTPKVKQGEVYLGDLEIVEERTGGFSPSFGWFKGKGKVDVDAPDVDIKGPEFEVEAPEVDVSIDKPDLDVDLKGPKVDVDVDKPDIDINGPEFDVSGGGDIDLKTPKVKQGELYLGDLEVVEERTGGFSPSFGWLKKKGKVDIDAPDVDIKGPEVEVEAPEVDVSIDKPDLDVDVKGPKVDVDVEKPDIDIKGPKLDVSGGGKFNLKKPKVKQGEVYLGDSEIVEEKTGSLSRGLGRLKKKGGKFEVSVPGGKVKGPKVEVEEPKVDVSVERPDIDVDVRGPKVDLDIDEPEADIKFKKPDIDVDLEGPDADIDLKGPKFDVSGGGDIDLKTPKVKQGEVYLGDLEIVEERTGGFSPSFGWFKGKGKVDVDAPDVDIKGPEFEVEAPEVDVSIDKPDLDVDVKGPKVDVDVDKPDFDIKGPEFDVSGGGDIDLKTPKVKQGELYLGDLEVVEERTGGFSPSFGWLKKKGKVDVDAPDVDIKGPEVEVEAPEVDVSIDKPDLDVDLRVPKGEFDIKGPEGDIDIKAPDVDVDVEGPKVDVDVDRPDIDIKGPKLDVSGGGKFNLKKPKIKQGEVYLGDSEIVEEKTGSLSRGLGWLKKKGGKFEVSVPGGKVKGPKVEVEEPKFDVSVERPDIDVDVKGPKVDLDIDEPEADIKFKKPDIDVDVEGPDADIDLKGPKFDVSGGGDIDLKAPKVKQGEVYLGDLEVVEERGGGFSPGFGWFKKKGKKDVDIDLGVKGGKVDIDAPEVDVKGPEFEIEEPKVDLSVDRPDIDLDVKGPDVELDIEAPDASIEVRKPDIDLELEGPKVDVEKPGVDITGPKVDLSAGGKLDLKAPKVKQGEVYLGDAEIVEEKTGFFSRSLGRLKKKGKKGDISLGVPTGKVEIGAPEVAVEGPEFDIEEPKVDVSVERPDFDVDVKGPKVDLDIDQPEADIKFKKPDIDVDVEGPDADIDLKGPKFDVSGGGDINLKAPKVKQGEVYLGDLEVVEERGGGFSPGFGWFKKGKKGKKDIDIDLGVKGGKVDIDAPEIDIKGPSFEIEEPKGDISVDRPDIDVDLRGPGVDLDIDEPEADIKFKKPEIDVDLEGPDADIDLKGPKFDVSGGGDIDLKAPKVKQGEVYLGDLEVVEERGGGFSPGFGWFKKKGKKDVDIDLGVKGGKVDIDAPEIDVKGPKFEIEEPGVDVSIDRPDLDVDVKGPKLDADFDKPDIDIKGPKVDVSGGGKIDVKAPKGKQGEVHIGDLEVVEDKPGFFSRTLERLRKKDKKGVAVGGKVDVDAPDIHITGPSVEAREPELDIDVPKFDADIETPSVDVDVKGPKVHHEVEGPEGDISVKEPGFGIKGPKIKGGGRFKLPKTPKGKQGEVYLDDTEIVEETTGTLSDSFGKIKSPRTPDIAGIVALPSVDVETPKGEVVLQHPTVEKPDIQVEGPEVDIHGPKIDVKGPEFESVDLEGPRVEVEGPEVGDLSVKGKADISGPDVDTPKSRKSGGFKFTAPKFGLKGKKIALPHFSKKKQGEVYLGDTDIVEDADLSVGTYKKTGDISLESPDIPDLSVGGELKSGDIDVEKPKVEGDIELKSPKVDIEGDVQGPKLDVEGYKIKGPEFQGEIQGPEVDVEIPEAEVKAKGDKGFKGRFHLPKLPKFHRTKQGEKYQGDAEVVEDWDKPKVKAPQIDIGGGVHIEAQKPSIEGPDFKSTETSEPHLEVRGGVSEPGLDSGELRLEGPELGGVRLHGPRVEVEGPEVSGRRSPRPKQGEVILGETELAEESKEGVISRTLGKFRRKRRSKGSDRSSDRSSGTDTDDHLDTSFTLPTVTVGQDRPEVEIDVNIEHKDQDDIDLRMKGDSRVKVEGPSVDLDSNRDSRHVEVSSLELPPGQKEQVIEVNEKFVEGHKSGKPPKSPTRNRFFGIFSKDKDKEKDKTSSLEKKKKKKKRWSKKSDDSSSIDSKDGTDKEVDVKIKEPVVEFFPLEVDDPEKLALATSLATAPTAPLADAESGASDDVSSHVTTTHVHVKGGTREVTRREVTVIKSRTTRVITTQHSKVATDVHGHILSSGQVDHVEPKTTETPPYSINIVHKDDKVIVTELKGGTSQQPGTSGTGQSPITPSTSSQLASAVYSPSDLSFDSSLARSHRSSVDSGTGSDPARPTAHFVVVAIDFGTTFSGYAFSFTRDPESIHMMRKWEGGDPGVINQKTPTCLLLTPEGEFYAFGFTARDFYHDLEPGESKKWLYFEKFKMTLHYSQVGTDLYLYICGIDQLIDWLIDMSLLYLTTLCSVYHQFQPNHQGYKFNSRGHFPTLLSSTYT